LQGRADHACVVTVDNKVLVAGGRVEEDGGGVESVSVEILDLNDVDAGWAIGPDMPDHRERFTLVLAGGGEAGEAPVAVGGWKTLPKASLIQFDGADWTMREEESSDGRDNHASVAYNGDYFDCEGGVGGDGGN